MTEFQKIFRIWIISTIFFIVISAVVAGGMVLYRLVKFENETKQMYVTLLDTQVEKSLPKLAEETYLGLGTVDVRQKELQEFLGSSGVISLQFIPKNAAYKESKVINQPRISNENLLFYPLFFGDFNLGKLKVSVIWRDSLNASLGNSIFPVVGLLVSSLVLFWLGFFFFIRKKALQPLLARVVSLERSGAIAKTTQMLAHDVRKPFSMLKMILEAVASTDDPAEMKELVQEGLPEVQAAMASVNGLIQDVMEIGVEGKYAFEPANPEALIEGSLNELFRLYPESNVNISYDLRHHSKISVDSFRVSRVFSNILGNAVQAMGGRGNLNVSTRNVQSEGKPCVEFCLGNAGSYIPPENVEKLFEAFFTSGKKGGTGLGLAISQKIVNGHGGKIWCESEKSAGFPDGIVRFLFTLPAAAEGSEKRAKGLPTSSSEIIHSFERLRKHSHEIEKDTVDQGQVAVELSQELSQSASVLKRKFRILVVDDESVYRNSLTGIISREAAISQFLDINYAFSSSEACSKLLSDKPDLVVLDVDLGPGSESGYQVLERARQEGFTGLVCIHSNRSLPGDLKEALSAGADAVLPKPMSRAHLFKLISQAIASSVEASRSAVLPISKLPKFAVVDDSPLVLKAWVRKSKGEAEVCCFAGPREFWKRVGDEQGFLKSLECVVTDFNFAIGEQEDGFSFARELKSRAKIHVFLSSDGEFQTTDLTDDIDELVSKLPLKWEQLQKLFQVNQ